MGVLAISLQKKIVSLLVSLSQMHVNCVETYRVRKFTASPMFDGRVEWNPGEDIELKFGVSLAVLFRGGIAKKREKKNGVHVCDGGAVEESWRNATCHARDEIASV